MYLKFKPNYVTIRNITIKVIFFVKNKSNSVTCKKNKYLSEETVEKERRGVGFKSLEALFLFIFLNFSFRMLNLEVFQTTSMMRIFFWRNVSRCTTMLKTGHVLRERLLFHHELSFYGQTFIMKLLDTKVNS